MHSEANFLGNDGFRTETNVLIRRVTVNQVGVYLAKDEILPVVGFNAGVYKKRYKDS